MVFDLQSFYQELINKKEYVDLTLQEYLDKENDFPPVIHQAMHYAVFNGGKRLRPILVFEAAKLAGADREQVRLAACAIELIHTYSLVHDDLPAMDDDDLRRGKPTCHKVFGEAIAILTGDALLTAAFGLLAQMADTPKIDISRVLKVIQEVSRAAGSKGMIGGQILDLDAEGKEIDYNSLKQLQSLKTGELFKVSLRAGAILGNMAAPSLEAVTNYAGYFGLAFQITDDILDVKGNPQIIGKPVGSDARNLKTTYPSLFGLEKAYQMAEDNVASCIESLRVFGEEADFLRDLAYFTLQRNS